MISVSYLVQLGGLEPPTSWSTAKRSNQLSYSCTASLSMIFSENRFPLFGIML